VRDINDTAPNIWYLPTEKYSGTHYSHLANATIRHSEGLAALDAGSQAALLRFVEGGVDPLDPSRQARNRPRREQPRLRFGRLQPAPEGSPPLVFGTPHELGSQRVALDLPADGEKILVRLDGKTLEAALIDVAGPRRVVVGMPRRFSSQPPIPG
jgi:hypothetical protein